MSRILSASSLLYHTVHPFTQYSIPQTFSLRRSRRIINASANGVCICESSHNKAQAPTNFRISMAIDRYVTPGEKVGKRGDFKPGHGVVEHNDSLIATLVGKLMEDPGSKDSPKPTIRVSSFKYDDGAPPLPATGSRVTAKVVKVNPRAAHAEIIVVDGKPLKELFKGTIRQQDVRQTEIDRVEIYKCFAPGDVVLAQVISLGDRHSYFLKTSENDLGVIYAKSSAGVPMVPISWQEMKCPATNAKEFRKVAKQ